ncbi:MAG: histidine phosphotransferase [Alphaproteobacteria bacterium]|jgi:histidine phosphotransferase ChpT|nr:histidine phosphotransferase [Alphaproteobacteria bacterium]MBT4020281.1 histidine phosphotransferase [Alphaproteobacteria bacterium]MBT4965446.1 histidine phosphotransferase [Alphaproteobacteria bacterium]MBT5158465.1 histidine phosphotransferase [Alphaproteobacteria bacterium]
MSDFLLAALISSRICHDLTGPVGAVSNGVELLGEESDLSMREQSLELLAFSAAETSRRLQFYRLCFGAAGGPDAVTSLGEAQRAAAGFFEGRKQDLNWPVGHMEALRIPQSVVQLVLNLILLAGEALPRGGQIEVELAADGTGISIQASGRNAALREDDLAALSGQTKLESLDSRTVQPWFSASVAREIGAEISVDNSKNEQVFLQAGPLFKVSD